MPAVKVTAFLVVLWFFILPLIPGFSQAAQDLSDVDPRLLLLGLALEMTAIFCYAPLTRVVLGEAGRGLSLARLYRIQLSTRAMANVVPGGSAAGSALGYRLMTVSGVPGPDAGFAVATAGIGSAVVLNLLLWSGLVISIPLRGVNALYGAAALVGILLMVIAAVLVLGIMDGQGRSERVVRRVARAFRLNEDRAARVLKHLGVRLGELTADRQMLRRLITWACAYWLLDAAALWVFLRAFGGNLSIDGLIVAFGLANVMAAIPITPGGLGIVEWVYIPTLVGFGLTRSEATLGVVSYRIAQFWLPIMLGTLSYLSLRLGPFSIDRRERLEPLQDVVELEAGRHESLLDFSERFSAKDRTGGQIRPPDPVADADRNPEPDAQ
jgi:uncharacterized protein (TIRG00374 family)